MYDRLLTRGTAHLLACCSENKSLDSTTAIENMVQELPNQAECGHLEIGFKATNRTITHKLNSLPLHHNSHGNEQKEQQPSSAPPIVSSPNEVLTISPIVIPVHSSAQQKQLPQGFGYISGGFKFGQRGSGTTNNMALDEFGEDHSQVHPSQ